MAIIRNQNDIVAASTADLIETYNAMTGKSIKKFSSRAAAETQTANALLIGVDRAGHAGVAKGENPKPATIDEVADKAAAVTAEKEDVPMATKKAAPAAKKTAAPAAPAKKAAAPAAKKAGRANVYTHVRLTKPDAVRRPQPGSKRTEVLQALQKRFEVKGTKSVSIEDLSKDCGFNTRSFVHKLAFQGWCEVIGA